MDRGAWQATQFTASQRVGHDWSDLAPPSQKSELPEEKGFSVVGSIPKGKHTGGAQ